MLSAQFVVPLLPKPWLSFRVHRLQTTVLANGMHEPLEVVLFAVGNAVRHFDQLLLSLSPWTVVFGRVEVGQQWPVQLAQVLRQFDAKSFEADAEH